MMNSRAYSYLDNIIVFEEIENMLLVFFLFIMTYRIPLLLGCYLECSHSHIIRYIPLPRMHFYPKLLAFTLYTKFLFYLLIPLPNLRNKNFRPLKVLSLFIPSIFPFIKLLTAFFDFKSSPNTIYASVSTPTIILTFIQSNLENTKRIALQLAILAVLIIIICNTSLLNPGPTKVKGLNCYFQNVQGLITFSSLGKPFPDLNITKISEFQTHIFSTSPDLIILNETWLKPSITDNEILPSDLYKIFRVDRSALSHSTDPANPKRFKTNGGGVLIGVKNALNLNPKIVNYSCKAEVISLELTLPNRKKICISTLYRVGTLAQENFSQL